LVRRICAIDGKRSSALESGSAKNVAILGLEVYDRRFYDRIMSTADRSERSTRVLDGPVTATDHRDRLHAGAPPSTRDAKGADTPTTFVGYLSLDPVK